MVFSALAVSAQKTVVPIVNFITLLGGSQNGKWIAAETAASALKDQTEFNIINFTGLEKVPVFGTKGERQGVCPEIPVIRLEEPETDDSEEKVRFALGANADWNPLPRIPNAINFKDRAYIKIVSDFLKTKGISKTQIEITQGFKIDLEGDGQDEIVIAGNYYKNGMQEEQSVGDYSFVLLRKTIKGKPQNILIGGDFFTSKLLDSAEYDPPNSHEISAIADLNGDGKMEIVVHIFYYEGNRQTVYEVKGGKLVKVLETECYV